MRIEPGFETDAAFLRALEEPGAYAFLVHIDPAQTYFPKISSRVTETGGMESNPLHRMTPDLEGPVAARVMRYLAG
jgi:acetolactate synthase-1/2/3 large subunit